MRIRANNAANMRDKRFPEASHSDFNKSSKLNKISMLQKTTIGKKRSNVQKKAHVHKITK